MTEHERIWLEAAPGADPDYGQQWCQHNVWGDDATEYVHVEIVTAKDAEIERLSHLLKQRDRMAETSRKFWVRAAKAAMNGDARELQNRVELSEAEPMQIVQSGGSDAP